MAQTLGKLTALKVQRLAEARWRGHLDKLLPTRGKVRAVRHHAATPYLEVPTFLVSLRNVEAVSARALEFRDPDGRWRRSPECGSSGSPSYFPASAAVSRSATWPWDMTLRRLGQDVTVHGFLSPFRDWGG